MYKPYFTCKYLDLTYPDALLVVDSQDIKFWLEFVALPDEYKEEITGMIILTGEGDLIAMWLTEYAAPYNHISIYHPLPYYQDENYNDRYPEYCKQSNPYYQIEEA